ncbi:MAG: DUF1801 domain-containing protein [Acidimicrobiales bacterium]
MNDAVAEWFATTTNPKAEVIRAVRDTIMADNDLTETVKWRAPAFEYEGVVCYVNWSSKQRVSLIFPTGARIPGDHPALVDGRNEQCMMYFDDLESVDRDAAALRAVIEAVKATR